MCDENSTNFFYYAYGERTQDGLICWLIKWAGQEVDPSDEECLALRECGRRFVNALLAKFGVELDEIEEVEIHQQDNRIDVLVRISGTYNGQPASHVLLIEDKVDGVANVAQLTRYREAVLAGQTSLMEVEEQDLRPILLKTGNFMYEDRTVEDGTPYKVFTRQDFLGMLNEYQGGNAILTGFRDYLQCLEDETNAWQHRMKGDWSQMSLVGFVSFLIDEAGIAFSLDYVKPRGQSEFLACWWDVGMYYVNGHKVKAYVQLEIGPRSAPNPDYWRLCLKINSEPCGEENAPPIPPEVSNILMDAVVANNETGDWAPVPPPPNIGISRTIARWNQGGINCSWLASDDDGHLDINQTVENLNEATEFWTEIMEQTPGITHCHCSTGGATPDSTG